ncbi:hypothetical protein Q7506_05670 [Glaesserella parasuis]|uniref:hypothetical protein n=1 Tax=Glaesserella parasuis TaxID=738 RepID=UPI001366278D|nr:hypothetical protein [Glaesserella parasuis]MCT8824716.1 hypothetical protein [Glaesserella parasuis]MDG6231809.1 hypothetical protein [Glaesserella parasuis]MDO9767398.1 hypothetical protein [Glaesserella parasuis]MWQ15134.1 hypothetical protein [Glaesserella parasuis]
MDKQEIVQAVSNEQVFAKLCEVEALLRERPLNENSRELWTVQQVADYFQCTYDHASRCIVSDPRFPAAVDIQGRTGGKSKNLYISGEVVQFCLKQKKKKAKI